MIRAASETAGLVHVAPLALDADVIVQRAVVALGNAPPFAGASPDATASAAASAAIGVTATRIRLALGGRRSRLDVLRRRRIDPNVATAARDGHQQHHDGRRC